MTGASMPQFWASAQNPRLRQLTERASDIAAKFVAQADVPPRFAVLQKFLQNDPDSIARLDFEKLEYYQIYEVARYAAIVLADDGCDFYDDALNQFRRLLGGRRGDSDNQTSLERLRNCQAKKMVLILKWLANVAEGVVAVDVALRDKARVCLVDTIAAILTDRRTREALEAFSDLVRRVALRAASDCGRGRKDVLIVPLLLGAEYLGNFMAGRLLSLGMGVRPLLLTRAMVYGFGMERDDKAATRRYLREWGLKEGSGQHLVFVDAGRRGTLREFLGPVLAEFGVTSSLVLLYHEYFREDDRHLAIGLNDEPQWTHRGAELEWFTCFFDDGLEHEWQSPKYRLAWENGCPKAEMHRTPRPWFHSAVGEMTRKLIGDLDGA